MGGGIGTTIVNDVVLLTRAATAFTREASKVSATPDVNSLL